MTRWRKDDHPPEGLVRLPHRITYKNARHKRREQQREKTGKSPIEGKTSDWACQPESQLNGRNTCPPLAPAPQHTPHSYPAPRRSNAHTHTLKAHKHSSTSHTPPSTQAPQLNITMSTMAALGCPGAVGSSWPSSPAAAAAAPRTVVAAPLLQGAGGVAQTKPADGRQACSTHGPGRS